MTPQPEQHSKERFGLDNPNRVEHVCDRGERYIHHTSVYKSQDTLYSPFNCNPEEIVQEIEEELDAAKVPSALDVDKEYIPRRMLRKILTPRRVRTILNLPSFETRRDKDELTTLICFGSTDSKPSLKLLGVLIGMGHGKVYELLKFMEDGMDDGCLPLELGLSNRREASCRKHEGNHAIINSHNVRKEDRDVFTRWAHSLTAPYISGNKNKHLHYVLHHRDVFPMELIAKMQKDDTSESNYGSSIGSIPQYGGFSEVYQVKIEKSHCRFDDVGMRHPDGYYALKKLNSHSRENFNLELSSLLFSMDNAATRRARLHLIQVLATFEVPNPTASRTNYYLLFDWAEGNLKDFWKRNEKLRGDMSHCAWMSKQFHEICLAMQCVHNDRDRTLKYIGSDASKLTRGPPSRNFEVDLYGRHGDIKPDNFLWFHPKRPARDLIVLSDFGLARLHTQASRSNQDPGNIARTATYIAPEFDLPGGMISRASDIFGLGCVFLEHVTWFLRGFDSVENEFPARRNQKDIYGFEADKFFVIHPDGPEGKQRAFLNPEVRKWIDELQQHEDCTWYLHQLLEIIQEKMLEPDRNKRVSISLLIEDMKLLRITCERNDSFYLKTTSEPWIQSKASVPRYYSLPINIPHQESITADEHDTVPIEIDTGQR
ncbi:protein kinase [Hypoxylon fragiforme]|uniref:protein kinase n=1 Tax=Hypoxylon fragiforme TaxID=63214 RepID=UPI0020C62DBE|nr:protein kinase [Hypoxylon fragiforme]KAI2613199.1 protein kinase [Hypoxylon fragiforme]